MNTSTCHHCCEEIQLYFGIRFFFVFQTSFSAQAYGLAGPKIRRFTFSLYVKYLYFGRKMEIISVTI